MWRESGPEAIWPYNKQFLQFTGSRLFVERNWTPLVFKFDHVTKQKIHSPSEQPELEMSYSPDQIKIDSRAPKLLFMGKIFIELLTYSDPLQHECSDERTRLSENVYI